MSGRNGKRKDARTEELRQLARRLRREGRMTAADWLRESAPIYERHKAGALAAIRRSG